ncbi:Acyl-CoA synthetase (AMP-forming)/AMP-acid ligase II [Sanguibacter gelidistatuariae]|uniref:Acyl-CoA synthetase (AMP-forming)/AMP-acid ligase II n=1 Tax=Sanguibacter gelidistatuariae TaxID=1814289 RepID=A0A1G6GRL7_9MICO|nr:alpha/beta fold hydrolase [Sanguibacter gelidistatuariae]SDB84640.1 Acyl-CoA synthetase (AMP-forming)/AMP-acid ligase II [Sanguibacter gelidistatuariae]
MTYDLPASASITAPAALPPRGLDGLDPDFSRLVTVPARDAGGASRTWHLLDNGAQLDALGVTPVGTILCVHGNPTWSYLWRKLVSQGAAAGWRVIAVDQLDMGFSERTGVQRGLPQRVRDLGELTAHVGLTGPVVTLGHDWGGVVSAGWALDHPDQLRALMLLNTAVHQPAADPIPAPLRLALRPAILGAATVRTPGFLETTLALAHPPLSREVKAGFRAPYAGAARRGGIGGFVADIPVDSDHPSRVELDRIAEGLRSLDVPALMLWGPRDPIFSDRYLDDLVGRLPHADVHRFEGAGHLVAEDVDYTAAVLHWLDGVRPATTAAPEGSPDAATPPDAATSRDAAAETAPAAGPATPATEPAPLRWSDDLRPMWDYLDALSSSRDTALVEMAPSSGPAPRTVSWRLLSRRVTEIAAGLSAVGVRHGDRVSLLVQPGADLTAVLYACLRIGAVVVVADAGLGVRGLTRAVRGAWPDHVIGALPGLTAARALGWPGQKISAVDLAPTARRALGVTHTLREIVALGSGAGSAPVLPSPPLPGDEAAILFTSGSTGPAKGVVYTHAQLCAIRDVLRAQYDVGVGTGLVAGFAPFALLGPALGTRSVTPDMDVTAPRTLTARGVAAAVAAADATVVFLSPAAITNVVATADELTDADHAALAGVRTFLSAGAPISESLLRAVGQLMPGATGHTPYGMTEGLLLTDITGEGIAAARALSEAAGHSLGVCVGTPTGPAKVLISALDADGRATGVPSNTPGVTGEIVASAPHLKDHYDRLWLTNEASVRGTGTGTGADAVTVSASPAAPSAQPGERWHRTGDVGHLDDAGRLWIEGRLAHVVVTAAGVVTPVGLEQDIESLAGVARAAVVGVGPVGTQQLVAVVETAPPVGKVQRATSELSAAVRAVSREPIAGVLVVPTLPTDVRHNSKIDRAYLSDWAGAALSGGRLRPPTSATRRLP